MNLDRYTIDPETDCWVWGGRLNRTGYGMVSDGGSRRREAHRAMYETRVGPIPKGLVLDHAVNPAHLEAVTHAENCRRGSATPLTADDVLAIRASNDPGTLLASRYGITRGGVSAIRHFKTWKEVR